MGCGDTSPPLAGSPRGEPRGCRCAPSPDNDRRVRGAGGKNKHPNKQTRQKKKKQINNTNLPYLSSWISSSASSWACISAGRSAPPTPCRCPGRMSWPEAGRSGPAPLPSPHAELPPSLEAAFIGRRVGRRCPAWRRGVAPPPRRAGAMPGGGGRPGRPLDHFFFFFFFYFLCVLFGTSASYPQPAELWNRR